VKDWVRYLVRQLCTAYPQASTLCDRRPGRNGLKEKPADVGRRRGLGISVSRYGYKMIRSFKDSAAGLMLRYRLSRFACVASRCFVRLRILFVRLDISFFL
jgi:hypothetical protein